jgi:hypothetical protein
MDELRWAFVAGARCSDEQAVEAHNRCETSGKDIHGCNVEESIRDGNQLSGNS